MRSPPCKMKTVNPSKKLLKNRIKLPPHCANPGKNHRASPKYPTTDCSRRRYTHQPSTKEQTECRRRAAKAPTGEGETAPSSRMKCRPQEYMRAPTRAHAQWAIQLKSQLAGPSHPPSTAWRKNGRDSGRTYRSWWDYRKYMGEVHERSTGKALWVKWSRVFWPTWQAPWRKLRADKELFLIASVRSELNLLYVVLSVRCSPVLLI